MNSLAGAGAGVAGQGPDHRRAQIAEGLARVRSRLAHAAEGSGRAPGAVRLVAVSKGRPAEDAALALAAGAADLGENRVAELVAKAEALSASGSGPVEPTWHLVGHLQRNKVAAALTHVGMLHSLDSARLGRVLDGRADVAGRLVEVLVEVNVSGEGQKHGVAPDLLDDLLGELDGLPRVTVRGLMCMAPAGATEADARRVFASLRTLADDRASRLAPAGRSVELSMGMTDDFEAAVAEGATIVRIGRAIFDHDGRR